MNYLHYTQVYFKWFLKGLYIFPICLAKVFLCTFAWLRSDSLWMRIHYLFFSIYSVINILSTHLVLCFFPPKSTWDKINVIFKRSHVSLRDIANHHSLYLFLLSLSGIASEAAKKLKLPSEWSQLEFCLATGSRLSCQWQCLFITFKCLLI